MGFNVIDQLLIRFFCIFQILKNKWEYYEIVHHLFIDYKREYDSVWREVLYNIFVKSLGYPTN
jgi:hypothetical protein